MRCGTDRVAGLAMARRGTARRGTARRGMARRGMARRGTAGRGMAGLIVLVIVSAVGCHRENSNDATEARSSAANGAPSGKLFGDHLSGVAPDGPPNRMTSDSAATTTLALVDIAGESGLEFVYDNGAAGRSLMVEAMGGGVGVLDYDLDGTNDLLFSQGGDPTEPPGPAHPPVSLFRNAPLATFTDVAAAAGLGQYGYGQGVAIGDYNADGFSDVYLTGVGCNAFLENMGDGTFREITQRTGTATTRWSSSAAFADLTGDGLLDLYVCNYLRYDPQHPLICRNTRGEHRICHPREVDPWPDYCFVNQGNGTFRDEASERGLVGEGSKGLGVVVADFDVDGAPDLYVANDTTANFLFTNLGGGRFEDRALINGCAVNYEGLFQASMGLAVGDYDGNGYLDVYSTHYYDDSNTLYRNLGPAGFQDVTGRVGLHTPTLQSLGFGTVMADLDCDGSQELFVTNGHVENYEDNPILEMKPQLFRFNGTRWDDVGAITSAFFQGKYVGRGVATVDVDNDGDLDLVVVHQNAPAALLRNDSRRGHWLKLTFVGHESPREGIGCRVRVVAGETEWAQELVGGSSYLSSHQPTLVFGLGESAENCRVEVRWPSGRVETLEDVAVNQTLVVEESDASR